MNDDPEVNGWGDENNAAGGSWDNSPSDPAADRLIYDYNTYAAFVPPQPPAPEPPPEPVPPPKKKQQRRPKTKKRPATALLVTIGILGAAIVLAALTLVLSVSGVIRLPGSADDDITVEVTAAPVAVEEATPDPYAELTEDDILPDEAEMYGEPFTAVVNEALNMRRGPGTENEVIEVLEAGQEVTVNAARGSWVWIDTGSAVGWVYIDYLTATD